MHFKSLSLLLLASCLSAALAEFTEKSALQYLKQFGYIHSVTDTAYTPLAQIDSEYDQNYDTALMDFQIFAGLPQTGILDQATENAMKTPRCGVKDYPSIQSKSNHQGPQHLVRSGKWEKKKLSYRIVKYSTKINNTDVDETCRKAMDLWEEAADIRFEHRPFGKVDIEISFGRRDHGDRNINGEVDERCGINFDGRGRILAHALLPPPFVNPACPRKIAGDIHIDEDEDWSVTYNKGEDLRYTITHEIGHSLGLLHSNGFKEDKKSPIMQPHHPGWVRNVILHKDDIERIQKLYGSPSTDTSPPNRPSWRLCSYQNPRGVGGGDCGDDDTCAGNFICGSNNCRQFHPNAHPKMDCCVQKI